MQEQNSELIVLTRQDLYDRVWTRAMRTVAPELGVSDVGLKKLCKRLDIPTPPLGYWAKKEYGKATKQPRLPAYGDAELEGIKFYPNAQEGRSEMAREVVEVLLREKAKENRIVVPDRLGEPCLLVERTSKSLKAARADDEGLVQPRAKKTLDVGVAPDNVERAMLIMDTLLKALDSRSLHVQLRDHDGAWATTVTVLDEAIDFALHEIVDRVERDPTPAEKRRMDQLPYFHGNDRFYNRVPSGRLCLEIKSGPANGRRHRFADTKRRPLANLLNTFVSTLFRTAEDIKVERKRLEELRQEREQQERRRQEWERQRYEKLEEIRAEEERVAALMGEAEAWHKSQAIRTYIQAARENLIEVRGEVVPDSDADGWLRWANNQADRVDPLTDSPPSVLDEKSKWDRSS